METQKNDEKNIVLEMKRLLGRMMVQVDYMYRNDREMSRLDLDIMMERTRDFYDLLCDYGVGANHHSPANEVAGDDTKNTEINEGGELINRDVDFEIETPAEVLNEPEIPEIPEEENDDKADKEKEHPVGAIHVLPVDDNDDVDEDEEDWEDEDDEVFHVEPVAEEPLLAQEVVAPVAEKKAQVERTVTLTERDIPITRPENYKYTPEEIALMKKQANEAYLKWVELEMEIAKNNLEQTAQNQ